MVDSRFYTSRGPLPLSEVLPEAVASALAGSIDLDVKIGNAAETNVGKPGDLVLVGSEKYVGDLANCNATAVLIRPDLISHVPAHVLALPVTNAHETFVYALERLFDVPGANGMASASDLETCAIEDGVAIHPSATIGKNVEIGRGSRIGANVVIGDGVCIGRDCDIGANSVVQFALLGDRVVVQACAVIGSAGFGWLDHGKRNISIPQLGRAIIQSDCVIGPNSTIDRGALGDTLLGENTKLGNGVVIGHNCQLGRNCLLAPTTGLAGTTNLGDGVIMGAGVGSAGHLSIGSGSVVYARAAVTKDWPDGSQLAGAPAQDMKDFWQELAMIRKLRRKGLK